MQTKSFAAALVSLALAASALAQIVETGPKTYPTGTTNVPSSGYQSTITTSDAVSVNSGATVYYNATSQIKLEPGFSATGGGVFYAQIVVQPPLPEISPNPVILSAKVGVPFSYTFTATNGPISSFAIWGTLPPGLTFNTQTGTLSGTPTQAYSTALPIYATNAYGQGPYGAFSINISSNGVPATTVTASSAGYGNVTGNTNSGNPPTLTVMPGSFFTITSTTTDENSDLVTQQFDLSTDGGSTWSLANSGNNRLWQGSPTGSNTLAKTFNLGAGTYLFRAYGTDNLNQTSTVQYVRVVVLDASQLVTQTYTTSGTFTVPSGVSTVAVLVVGGGGGGGWHGWDGGGGGGGGGGVMYNAAYAVAPGQQLSVVVGSGGRGGYDINGAPTNGGSSSFDSITALGGGAGGTWGSDAGFSGASGGGGDDYQNSPGGAGTQGNNGGAGSRDVAKAGGGGGGATAAGANGDGTTGNGGVGGAGYTYNGVVYGSGGGGGSDSQVSPAVGGDGGGYGGTPSIVATSGTDGRGGGGGGSGLSNGNGGNGGAGIVIVVYGTSTPSAPAITSATSTNATVGLAFTYQITATNAPTNFGATGLPAGLNLNASSGLISGTPTATGTSSVVITASNSVGTGSATLTLVVNASTASPPVITSLASASGTVGVGFTYVVMATNNPTNFGATGLPPGLSLNPSSGLITGTPNQAGTFSVQLTAANAGGTGSMTLLLTIGATAENDSNNQNQLNIHLPLLP